MAVTTNAERKLSKPFFTLFLWKDMLWRIRKCSDFLNIVFVSKQKGFIDQVSGSVLIPNFWLNTYIF